VAMAALIGLLAHLFRCAALRALTGAA
jgi:hypothetical protein